MGRRHKAAREEQMQAVREERSPYVLVAMLKGKSVADAGKAESDDSAGARVSDSDRWVD